MPAAVTTTGPTLTDEQVDRAATTLPPVPDNIRLLIRHLQDQITELRIRIVDLEAAS